MPVEDTRDIAIEVRTKVERLETSVEQIEKDMRRLMTIVDQGSGVAGTLRVLGYSSGGGLVALIADNWQTLSKKIGL
jgi:hypothetical protein